MNVHRSRNKSDSSPLRQLIHSLENGNASNQHGTLSKIRGKLSDSNQIKEFHKAGGLAIILPLLEKPKLLDLTVSILANCCLDVDAREWLLDNNGISPIVQAFKCLASESIQNRCCRALANLALSPRGAFLLHKESILSLVVKFLTETTDPLCQLTAVRAIRLLTGGSFYKSILVEENGVLPVVDLLKSDNAKVVSCALKTLSTLTEHCKPEIAEQVQRSEAVTSIVTLCTCDNYENKENALITLVNLSTQSVIRPVLGNSGAVQLLIKLIENPETQRPNALSLVTALCFYCRESCSRVKVRDNDGLKVLLNILNNADTHGIHERVVFSLLAFRYDEASLDVLMELGLIDILVEQLNKYVEKNAKEHNTKPDDENGDVRNVNLEMTPKPFVSYANVNELSKDEESELLSVMKLAKLSKVFCIHSPSYQLVQNEVKIPDNPTDIVDPRLDTKYRDVQSPASINSYCLSPDASSLDWSLPGSPLSSRPRWSQSPSPTNMSSCDSDLSPAVSPSTSSFNHQYSPVLNDEIYSDAEVNAQDEMVTATIPKEMVVDKVLEDLTPKLMAIPKRKHVRKRTISEDGSGGSNATRSKVTRRQSTSASTCSDMSSTGFRSHKEPENSEEESTMGGQIVQLLSHLSHMEKHSDALATKDCVQAILKYLSRLAFVSPRAKRLLVRLLGDYKCFEALILFDIIDLINDTLEIKHTPASTCCFCTKLEGIKQKLRNVMSSVSESGYGIGILSHIILTGTTKEIAKCVLAIPHLIRGHYQLRKLLCDCGGLIQLLRLLDSENRAAAVQSLSVLCRNCFSHAFKNYNSPVNPTSKCACAYATLKHDVEFALDDNTVMAANRATLCANSDYFKAMLEGSFAESVSNLIKLRDVTRDALLTVFHYLYGCNVITCSPLSSRDVHLSLEVLSLCDRFMIDNLSKVVTGELLRHLNPGNVKLVYAHSVKFSYEDLSTAVLKYVMIGEMTPEQRLSCFEDLKSSPGISKVFIGDIKETILKQFPESKSATKQLTEGQL